MDNNNYELINKINELEGISRRKAVYCIGGLAATLMFGCKGNTDEPSIVGPSPNPTPGPTNPIPPTPQVTCPGEIIGNPSFPPEVHIVGLKAGDALVNGTANNLDARINKIVLWAQTNRWYVQPSIASPFTNVCSNGTWKSSTYPWQKLVALLVNQNYVPGSIRDEHPSQDKGVLAWNEFSAAQDRSISFSGFNWQVKDSSYKVGPGPNYFSNSESNIWTAGDGLHLKIANNSGKWNCSEIVLDHSLGYGEYTYRVASRVDNLDYNAVFSGFLYESLSREIDIAFSRVLANPNNMQFVVQPYTTAGNILRFNMPGAGLSTHRINWQSDRIDFNSWVGDGEPNSGNLIKSWRYTGRDIPPPGGERMRFNLWLFNGVAPNSGIGDEVVVKSFDYRR